MYLASGLVRLLAFPTQSFASESLFVFDIGACNASAASGGDFILETSDPSKPVYEQLTWRYNKIDQMIPWVKGVHPKLYTHIAYARTSMILRTDISHYWVSSGQSLYANPACLIHNHYKVLPWQDQLAKNQLHASWYSSNSTQEEHRKMNELLCKEQDNTLVGHTRDIQTWADRGIDAIVQDIKDRTLTPRAVRRLECQFPPEGH